MYGTVVFGEMFAAEPICKLALCDPPTMQLCSNKLITLPSTCPQYSDKRRLEDHRPFPTSYQLVQM